jgi:cell division protein FtsN
MTDSGFREIQLGGKQVVFLFMAGAVAAVAIFLLGVSVGRNVPAADVAADSLLTPDDVLAQSDPSAPLPPPATPAPGELKYHETLLGKPDPTVNAATPTTTPTPTPTPKPTPTTKPAAPPKPAPTTKPAPVRTPPATAIWYVQVNSFNSRPNALSQVSQLKAKGITAAIVETPGTAARYRVRVGPMDRAAADALNQRLRKEGYRPSVIR